MINYVCFHELFFVQDIDKSSAKKVPKKNHQVTVCCCYVYCLRTPHNTSDGNLIYSGVFTHVRQCDVEHLERVRRESVCVCKFFFFLSETTL
jgi:hypothetical protein